MVASQSARFSLQNAFICFMDPGKKRQTDTQSGAGRRPRRRGRPTGNDSDAGETRIVSATTELLKTTPPSRLSGASIAEAAGVDPKLIRYYFGDTKNLLAAVAVSIANSVRERYLTLGADEGPALERLRARIRGLMQAQTEHPHFHNLMIDVVLYGEGEHVDSARHEILGGALAALTEITKAGAAEGEMIEVDPRYLHIAVLGMCEFFIRGRPNLSRSLDPADIPAEEIERYTNFICDLVIDGVRQHGRD